MKQGTKCANTNGCVYEVQTRCVVYDGSYLKNLGIISGQNLTDILSKIDQKIGTGGGGGLQKVSHINSSTISIVGDGTDASPLQAHYIGGMPIDTNIYTTDGTITGNTQRAINAELGSSYTFTAKNSTGGSLAQIKIGSLTDNTGEVTLSYQDPDNINKSSEFLLNPTQCYFKNTETDGSYVFVKQLLLRNNDLGSLVLNSSRGTGGNTTLNLSSLNGVSLSSVGTFRSELQMDLAGNTTFITSNNGLKPLLKLNQDLSIQLPQHPNYPAIGTDSTGKLISVNIAPVNIYNTSSSLTDDRTVTGNGHFLLFNMNDPNTGAFRSLYINDSLSYSTISADQLSESNTFFSEGNSMASVKSPDGFSSWELLGGTMTISTSDEGDNSIDVPRIRVIKGYRNIELTDYPNTIAENVLSTDSSGKIIFTNVKQLVDLQNVTDVGYTASNPITLTPTDFTKIQEASALGGLTTGYADSGSGFGLALISAGKSGSSDPIDRASLNLLSTGGINGLAADGTVIIQALGTGPDPITSFNKGDILILAGSSMLLGHRVNASSASNSIYFDSTQGTTVKGVSTSGTSTLLLEDVSSTFGASLNSREVRIITKNGSIAGLEAVYNNTSVSFNYTNASNVTTEVFSVNSSGHGKFTGTVEGLPAVNPNEFITKQQLTDATNSFAINSNSIASTSVTNSYMNTNHGSIIIGGRVAFTNLSDDSTKVMIVTKLTASTWSANIDAKLA